MHQTQRRLHNTIFTHVAYEGDNLQHILVGLSRFTHVTIRFDSVRSRSDRFDPIHYLFVQTNTTKISNSECHLKDLLKKITMSKMTMNEITMNKEHKIHHNTSASNCNNIILFVILDTNQFVGIFWQLCRWRGKNSGSFQWIDSSVLNRLIGWLFESIRFDSNRLIMTALHTSNVV